MSDGELKKRIFGALDDADKYAMTIDLSELQEILDEAKKEFPETWFDPRGKTLIENYGEAILRLQDTVKYKLKWFGGNK